MIQQNNGYNNNEERNKEYEKLFENGRVKLQEDKNINNIFQQFAQKRGLNIQLNENLKYKIMNKMIDRLNQAADQLFILRSNEYNVQNYPIHIFELQHKNAGN